MNELRHGAGSATTIVIESSGVSEPRAVRDNFQDAEAEDMALFDRVRLDTLVTVVDLLLDAYASRSILAERTDRGGRRSGGGGTARLAMAYGSGGGGGGGGQRLSWTCRWSRWSARTWWCSTRPTSWRRPADALKGRSGAQPGGRRPRLQVWESTSPSPPPPRRRRCRQLRHRRRAQNRRVYGQAGREWWGECGSGGGRRRRATGGGAGGGKGGGALWPRWPLA